MSKLEEVFELHAVSSVEKKPFYSLLFVFGKRKGSQRHNEKGIQAHCVTLPSAVLRVLVLGRRLPFGENFTRRE